MPVMFAEMPESLRNFLDFPSLGLHPRNINVTMVLDILKGCLQAQSGKSPSERSETQEHS
jgi:hypothetical protein